MDAFPDINLAVNLLLQTIQNSNLDPNEKAELEAKVNAIGKTSLTEMIVSKDGNQLIKKSFWNRFSYALGFERLSQDTKMGEFINGIVDKLQTHLDLFQSTDQKEALRTLVFNKLGALNKQQFDRGHLSKEMQHLLSEGLKDAREKNTVLKQALRADPTVSPEGLLKAKYERRLEVIHLASKLGMEAISNTARGATSFRFCNLKGKEIAIFKQRDTGFWKASFVKKMGILYRRAMGYRRQSDLVAKHRDPYYTEVAACFADRFFDIGLTPETHIADIKGVKGSLQVFVKGYFTAKETNFKPLKDATSEEISLFQRFVIFDYFLGNLDRHLENWLVKPAEGGKGMANIALIDHEHSFPEEQPTGARKYNYARKHQYEWADLPLSKASFTEENCLLMKKMASEVEKFIESTNNDPELTGYFSENMIVNLRTRARALEKAAMSPTSTPAMLRSATS